MQVKDDLQVICEALSLVRWSVDWHAGTLRLFPFKEGYFLGQPAEKWTSLEDFIRQIHPEDQAGVRSHLERVAYREGIFQHRFRIIDENLRIKYFNSFGQFCRSQDKSAIVLNGYLEDVTHAQSTERFFTGRRKVLEMLATGAPLKQILDAILVQVEEQYVGLEGVVLLLDEEGKRLNVVSAPRIPVELSTNLDNVEVSPEVGTLGTAAFYKTLMITEDISTAPNWANLRQVALDHNVRACWSMPLFSSTGEVMGIVSLFYSLPRAPNDFDMWLIMDIAKLAAIVVEHDQIRTQRSETFSLLNSSLDATGEGVVIFDLKGKVLSINSNFYDLWSLPGVARKLTSSREALNWTEAHVKDSDVYRKRIEEINQDLEGEAFDVLELKDGRVFERHSKPHRVAGVVSGRIWCFRDITKWQISEQEALSARKAKTLFLANVSHEIRTPLSAVLGFSEMLVRAPLDHPERKRWMDRIKQNGDLLLKVVNEILDVSRADHGKIEVEMSQVNVGATLSDVVAAFEQKAREKGILIDIKTIGSIPREIRTDRFKLQQILINIVGNALKFIEKGRIDIVLSWSEPNSLQINVMDTGPGIRPDRINSLFLPFEQGDDSYSRKFGGAGLGLALSRKMARALGGDVKLVSSTLGKGTHFLIELSTESVDAETTISTIQQVQVVPIGPAPISVPKRPLEGTKILLVEDSEDNRFLVSELLRQAGADVDVAVNGAEGVDKALEGHFDAVLMDIQMPIKDGLEATRELRKKHFTAPILALTAHALAEERERTAAAGCSDHITKPIRRNDLIDSLVRNLHLH